MTVATAVPITPELTALDRCDHRECGAQAWVRLTMGTAETALQWCLHHYAGVANAMADQGFAMDRDDLWKLATR